jgi:hypothetical protein
VTLFHKVHAQVALRRIAATHLPTVDGLVDVTFAVVIVLLADDAVDTVFNNKTPPHTFDCDRIHPPRLISRLLVDNTRHT